MNHTIYDQWSARFTGVIDRHDIKVMLREDDRWWSVCPCGEDDHYASNALVTEGFCRFPCDILNCYITGKQWLIRPVDVAGIIRKEEEAYIKLIKSAPNIVSKIVGKRGVSDETFAFLKDTHGIDRELAEEILKELNQ